MALGQHCAVLQIVGYQNSGKTTLMEKLIAAASEEGARVATIKHHGHGGVPAAVYRKDSQRHEKAGAVIAGVEGAGTLCLTIQQASWELEELVELYQSFRPNMILVEGYKKADYPKVVLIRHQEDVATLQKLTNIICVLYWQNVDLSPFTCPAYSIRKEALYMELLLEKVRN
ncbi:molybdopterin-guanine dinucleotide biosynthesis protein B [Rummeliibacillus pycnus]|uniref:molybdopterin-guanine dinucleotide biosynthesis protein B n=1 Tax=Rummeliibacillus pycnus TaxID=101070 RepID=UPI000C9B39BB|nr:molybdopterin-guanine dinucleotide biosynthesis protein B [Rummeliibacillus pycnus]